MAKLNAAQRRRINTIRKAQTASVAAAFADSYLRFREEVLGREHDYFGLKALGVDFSFELDDEPCLFSDLSYQMVGSGFWDGVLALAADEQGPDDLPNQAALFQRSFRAALAAHRTSPVPGGWSVLKTALDAFVLAGELLRVPIDGELDTSSFPAGELALPEFSALPTKRAFRDWAKQMIERDVKVAWAWVFDGKVHVLSPDTDEALVKNLQPEVFQLAVPEVEAVDTWWERWRRGGETLSILLEERLGIVVICQQEVWQARQRLFLAPAVFRSVSQDECAKLLGHQRFGDLQLEASTVGFATTTISES